MAKTPESAASNADGTVDVKYRYTIVGEDDKTPEEKAWTFSKIYFLWTRKLFQRAAHLQKQGKALENDDLLPLTQIDRGKHISKTFEDAWDYYNNNILPSKKKNDVKAVKAVKASKSSETDTTTTEKKKDVINQNQATDGIRYAILKVLGPSFYYAGFIKLINTLVQFTFPILLYEILTFIEERSRNDGDEEINNWWTSYKGYWLSALLFLAMGFKAVTENYYFHLVYRGGYQARVAVTIAVFNKSTRLANSERQSTTLGELVNLMQIDATKIEMFVPQAHVLWDGLLQISGYMVVLYRLIGWPCFVGLALMLIATPGQGVLMMKLFGMNRLFSKWTDKRIKTINEALQGIQCVKMYTWENSFKKDINKSRNDELIHLKGVSYLTGFVRAYMSALPALVAVVALVTYALATSNPQIKASVLFAALTAFEQLRFPLLFYPFALANYSQAKVSSGRVQGFLSMQEIKSSSSTSDNNNDVNKKTTNLSATGGTYQRTNNSSTAAKNNDTEIVVDNATVYWSDPTVPIDVSKKDDSSAGSLTGDDVSTQKSQKSDDEDSVSIKSVDLNETAKKNGSIEISGMSNNTAIYPKPILKNISTKVEHGKLVAVVGRVGCGKSTLCAAILNETILESGDIRLKGSVAFAAQTPWILNATLRDNILFGAQYDENKYKEVIDACQLSHDLELLEDGDQTEIGERGINLSGGQKQRVSIARAAYSNAEVIILDDPLSALDPEVGRKLFEECILKIMAGKTRLFVTNQLQFLTNCDRVVALKRGKIVEQGTYEDLMNTENGEVRRLLKDSASRSSNNDSKNKKNNNDDSKKLAKDKSPKKTETDGSNADSSSKGPAKALVSDEERNVGAVRLSVYLNYIKAGGGYLKFMVVIFFTVINMLTSLASSSIIAWWSSDATYEQNPQWLYLTLYGILAILVGVFTYIRVVALVRFGISASENLHSNLIQSVFKAPQSFFDTTPIGRILARFSADMYTIDLELSNNMDFVLFCSLQIIAAMGAIIYATPLFCIAIIPLAYMYITIMNYFRSVSRETKRLESVSRSPIYAQFSETLGGLTTIRAYDQPTRFMNEFEKKVDKNTKASYSNKTADRWLAIRLETIGAIISGLAAFLATHTAVTGTVSASLAGLSLTYAVGVTGLLSFGTRSYAQLEASMNSAERVLYYTEEIPHEAPFTSEELENEIKKESLEKKPKKDDEDEPSTTTPPSTFAVVQSDGKVSGKSGSWPEKGAIELRNLKMRYRSDTPLVLRGLNLTIQGGERVGVVGRTGSGKSSLFLTLLRLVEPDVVDMITQEHERDKHESKNEENPSSYVAPISIDGVDTLRIGLEELRSKIAIIPQNPVLFSGTIRSNIDPFNDYTDEDVWKALQGCGMATNVEVMPGLLQAEVAEYGENLSAGMRQLLVLGRALLKQCKILLLDEATSSVDYETDKEIQRTIREAFCDCTVLTIAHRINTILDSDKILVMKDGLVDEYAPPNELLADETSTFFDIVSHTETSEQDQQQ